jgi:hypothetical protein
MNRSSGKLSALGMLIFILALALHPAAAGLALGLVLVPVLLFGLVLVPRSLWPAFDPKYVFAVPPLGRAALFQRPPPFSLQ